METTAPQQAAWPSFDLLKAAYGLLFIITGLDKFAGMLTDWTQYLSSYIMLILPVSAHTFIYALGIIELAAGIMMLLRPVVGGIMITSCLAAIGLNHLVDGLYLDIALMDFAMTATAFAITRQAMLVPKRNNPTDRSRRG